MTGTINYHEKQVPFSFDEEDYILSLNITSFSKDDIIGFVVDDGGHVCETGKERLDSSFLTGKLDDNRIIFFSVSHYFNYLETSIEAEINDFVTLLPEFTLNNVNNIHFLGPEIDQITKCKRNITCQRKDDGSLEIRAYPMVSHEIDLVVKKQSLSLMFYGYWNFSSENRFLQFCSGISLSSKSHFTYLNIQNYHLVIHSLISFLCARRNVTISKTFLYAAQNNLDTLVGEYHISQKQHLLPNANDDSPFIPLSLLETHFSPLLYRFFNDNLYWRGIPRGTKNDIITSGDYVVLSAAFEYEYQFSKKYDNHLNAKTSMNNARDIPISDPLLTGEDTGKKSKHKKYDNRISTKLKEVIGKDETLFNKVGRFLYQFYGLPYDYPNICEEIRKKRNHFAHAYIKEKFDQESIINYLFLERIVYSIQLKNCGYSSNEIYKIINSLFLPSNPSSNL